MNFIFTFGFVIAIVSFRYQFLVGAQKEWVPLTPEETYFTYTRCMEDHFGGDYALLTKWRNWQLPEDDQKTPCYTKCILERLELFDPSSSSFKPERIPIMHQKYAEFTGATAEEASKLQEAFNSNPATGSDCKAVFDAYVKTHKQYGHVGKKIYLGDKPTVLRIHAADPTIKRKGESAFRHCEKKFFADGSEHLCKKRNGEIPPIDELLSYQECILKTLKYMDRNGRTHPEEVKRDFHEVGVTDKDSELDQMFSQCGSDVKSYYVCLWGSTGEIKNQSMKALDYREIRSMDYSYNLNPASPPYDAGAIKQKVIKIDEEAGCAATHAW